MISTFQALVVAVLALLPGASYLFAYERIVGSYSVSLPDRLVRFLAASAIFQAVLSGPEFLLYRQYVVSHRFERANVNWAVLEGVALGYVLLPYALGSFVGWARKKGLSWSRWLTGSAIEPRAWDHLWKRHKPAVVRMKLKSGPWLAGLYGSIDDVDSYASGYPEAGDLYLRLGLQINPDTGELVRDSNQRPVPVEGNRGLLVRWEEIEYLDYQEF